MRESSFSAEELYQLHVLFVDDNDHMRQLVTTILRVLGVAETKTVANPALALDVLKKGYLADLVLTNYDMQPMNGTEFTRRLRRGEGGDAHRMVPVLMVSAFSEVERVVKARDSGIDYYLVKPLSPRVLLEHIVSVLKNPRAHVEAEKYAGPDRRHRSANPSGGPDRRGDSRGGKQGTSEQGRPKADEQNTGSGRRAENT